MATNNLESICICPNGCNVYLRSYSNLHKGVSRELLLEALSKVSPTKKSHAEIVDMHHIIGQKNIVKIDESDKNNIVYVIRKGKKFPSVMVKGRTPIDCSYLTVILKQLSEKDYVLVSAFIGDQSEPEPWDPCFYDQNTLRKRRKINKSDYQKSVEFWKHHAFVYDKEKVSLHLS